MNYVFWGTPRFADIVLAQLIDAGMAPRAIVCNPDRAVGRKKIITAPLTKQRVLKNARELQGSKPNEIFQPEKIDPVFVAELQSLKPDFFVVAAYAKIIPQAALDIPRLGTLGVHPSLLPRYRGASPIQSAILEGERETGATIYLMDKKMDHGPILAQKSLAINRPIYELSYSSLEEKLAVLSGQLAAVTITHLVAKDAKPKPQDEMHATFTRKFTAQDAFVDEKDLAAAAAGDAQKSREILCKINAFNPEPGAWTMQDGKRVKLLEAEIRGGKLALLKMQKEGEAKRA